MAIPLYRGSAGADGASCCFNLLLYTTQMFLVVFHFLTLCITECTHTLEHFIPIDKCSVKLRTVDAHKLGLTSNRKAASTTHTGAINHNRVQ